MKVEGERRAVLSIEIVISFFGYIRLSSAASASGHFGLIRRKDSAGIIMVYRWSLLLVVFMAVAILVASEDKGIYVVHMDKAKTTALDNILGDSKKWFEAVMDYIVEQSAEEDGAGQEETSAPELLYSYETALTGFAARLSTNQLEALNKIDGFLSAVPDEMLTLQTTHSYQFLGLQLGKSSLFSPRQLAKDVIIGFVDSGIWPEHVSFQGESKIGPVPSRWKGICEEGTRFTAKNCNKKIIGARAYYKGYEEAAGKIDDSSEFRSARDSQGHGSHTASTAAGDMINGASFFGMAKGVAAGMSSARIAAYKACYVRGCATSDILAAIDQAVSDGVDVLSLSIGGSVRPHYSDVLAIASLGAVQRGVFVTAAAGNSGPFESSVVNVAPWMMTVAASTMDRSFLTVVTLGNGETYNGESLYSGSMSVEKLALVYGASSGRTSSTYCTSGTLSPELVKGKIVVCERGRNRAVEKGQIVKMAGGAGMLLLNTKSEGEYLRAEPHILPATSLGALAAASIRKYLSSKNPTASIVFKGTVFGNQAPVMASFSSRGPAIFEPYVIKPDVTAPGVNILAAWPPTVSPSETTSDNRSVQFNVISGTSMSCPHVSGLAAILKGAHRGWSPAAIKSALMTTAYTQDNKKNPISDSKSDGQAATPFAYGSGHVNPVEALKPGLIYDISYEDYLNYLCSLNFSSSDMGTITRGNFSCPSDTLLQPGDLNYPSFAVLFEAGAENNSARHTRTVTYVGSSRRATFVVQVQDPEGVSVIVEPKVLRFRRTGQKGSYTVSFVESGERSTSSSDSSFGSLVWVSKQFKVRSPIAVTWQEV